MKVKIIDKLGWMGHPEGAVIEVQGAQAREMISRRAAKVYKAPKDKMVKEGHTRTK